MQTRVVEWFLNIQRKSLPRCSQTEIIVSQIVSEVIRIEPSFNLS